jgi:hypothetical protein
LSTAKLRRQRWKLSEIIKKRLCQFRWYNKRGAAIWFSFWWICEEFCYIFFVSNIKAFLKEIENVPNSEKVFLRDPQFHKQFKLHITFGRVRSSFGSDIWYLKMSLFPAISSVNFYVFFKKKLWYQVTNFCNLVQRIHKFDWFFTRWLNWKQMFPPSKSKC